MPAAGFDQGRIALDDGDLLQRQIEMLRDQLRIGRHVALAVRLRADQDLDAAIRLHADIGALGAAAGAGLDIGGHANAARLACLLRGARALLEAGPVGHLHGAAHGRFEFTGIIDAPHLRWCAASPPA